ncbi:MAG TPA: M1 family aminopeptidase [Gemmatimonadaceae bacterium]|nr:M1 family aminopeptidase [Gemmatimonadaceae bacterium]
MACLLLLAGRVAAAQGTSGVFTHADTLRGSITPERAWWDVTFYDLHVAVSPADSTIRGWNGITYRVVQPAREMQIDLQQPLDVDSMVQADQRLTYRRDGNAFFVTMIAPQTVGSVQTITVYYHGRPHVAKRAPWDGGIVWARDSLGHPWIATACQGFGASVWWPTKDTQADEPDSQRVAITVPDSLQDVSNGRLRGTTHHDDGTTTYEWFVDDPINNYDVAANIGKYAHFSDTYAGAAGALTLDFWPLAYHLDTARAQFAQARSMLRCFESWFGPYPWYKDGYKLIETPHLGMEHQSGIAYGNGFQNGYRGRDRSGTGWGLGWDFIIVHESAHEWFGNNITTADIADMWVHESFANYAEGLYTECLNGPAAGAAYIVGDRGNVRNDEPIIGPFGVNREGSGDMYDKGGNMLHAIRLIIGNDSTWRSILQGLNTTFWHQVVTGAQVEQYITARSGHDLATVFAQYLTTTRVPVFEYTREGTTLAYHWGNAVTGFDMPVRVLVGPGTALTLRPTEAWQTATVPAAGAVRVDSGYYVVTQRREHLVARAAETVASLRGLSVAADGTIWASGTHATILRSVDGGATWRVGAIREAGSRDIRDIEAVSGTTAYAMVAAQDTGQIYKTTDAGRTWTLQYTDTRRGVFLDGFAFWGARHGIVFGDPIGGRWLLGQTTDGTHWGPVADGVPRADSGEAGFAASGTSIAVEPRGQVWIATGGDSVGRVFHARHIGGAWTVAGTPIAAGTPSTGIFSLAFADSLRGVAVGGDYRAPDAVRVNVARTVDGGHSWTRGDTTGVVKYLSGVAYVSGTKGRVLVGVGTRGVFRSRDGGLTWEGVSTDPYNSVAATRDGVVMVGDRGAIATWDVSRASGN